MARISQGLNPRELQSLPEGEHCDGGGLYLRVTGMGGRSWIVKYQWAKKQEKMGIGSLADVGLAAGRKKASTIREQAGRDGYRHAGGGSRFGPSDRCGNSPCGLDKLGRVAADRE
jgi:Arm DNA-binding domain